MYRHGPLKLFGEQVPRHYRVVDPRTGVVLREGTRASADEWILDDGGGPRIYICYEQGSCSAKPSTTIAASTRATRAAYAYRPNSGT